MSTESEGRINFTPFNSLQNPPMEQWATLKVPDSLNPNSMVDIKVPFTAAEMSAYSSALTEIGKLQLGYTAINVALPRLPEHNEDPFPNREYVINRVRRALAYAQFFSENNAMSVKGILSDLEAGLNIDRKFIQDYFTLSLIEGYLRPFKDPEYQPSIHENNTPSY